MSVVLPGQIIGHTSTSPSSQDIEYANNTYTHQNDIHSLIWGTTTTSTSSSTTVTPIKNLIYPTVNSVVLCRVIKVSLRWANVIILTANGVPLAETSPLVAFKGIIRQTDIRSTEKDKVTVYNSFRPGDLVRAIVIGVGESNGGLYLSTAKNELGVVQAIAPPSPLLSEQQQYLIPISWTQMQHPITKTIYNRKVACPLSK